jgi:hypothetical protein
MASISVRRFVARRLRDVKFFERCFAAIRQQPQVGRALLLEPLFE